MPSVNAPSSSAGATATDLRKPEDVGEPQPDEPDVTLLESAENEVFLLAHGANYVASRKRRSPGVTACSLHVGNAQRDQLVRHGSSSGRSLRSSSRPSASGATKLAGLPVRALDDRVDAGPVERRLDASPTWSPGG